MKKIYMKKKGNRVNVKETTSHLQVKIKVLKVQKVQILKKLTFMKGWKWSCLQIGFHTVQDASSNFLAIYLKEGIWCKNSWHKIHTHTRQNPKQRNSFYCCSSSQSHSEAFNTEQRLTPHRKFKAVPSTGLSGILC